MELPQPLLKGVLLRRYKRFFSDVRLDSGEEVTAHCANSGSMLSVSTAGSEVWLSRAPEGSSRRLRYTWELIRVGGHLVGINTFRPNALVAEALAEGRIDALAGYSTVRREVRYGQNSRIDLLLEAADRPKCYVEVKNVTLKRDGDPLAPAEFPDAVTSRGTKHLAELAHMVGEGNRSMLIFVTQREDCERMTIAADIDPDYWRAFAEAEAAGVEIACFGCAVSTSSIRIARPIAFARPGDPPARVPPQNQVR